MARGEHEGRPAVRLDRTAFYPESGGQPWDTGVLGVASVVAVVDSEAGPLHVLEKPLEAERIVGRVDGRRREDHRQQHHGQHLLSRALVEVASARTIGFHLGSDDVTIDLDRDAVASQIRAAEDLANRIVAEARPVAVRIVTRAECIALGIEPPQDAGDEIRLVGAEGFDLQPCGGTHPRRTSEVGIIRVLSTERYKSGSRVRFACGWRALETWRVQSEALARIGGLLSAPVSGLAGALEKTLARARDLEKQLEIASSALLAMEARDWFEEARRTSLERPLVVRRTDGRSPAQLRTLALEVVRTGPSAALLGSEVDGKVHLVFAQGPGFGLDLAALLKVALERVGGRGGGRGDVVQGGGDRIDGLDAALECARQGAMSNLSRPR